MCADRHLDPSDADPDCRGCHREQGVGVFVMQEVLLHLALAVYGANLLALAGLDADPAGKVAAGTACLAGTVVSSCESTGESKSLH